MKRFHSDNINMTEGNPASLLIRFAGPLLIGSLFQQIYNVVDTLIVGRYLGEEALAGVGSTGTLSFFLFALALGFANGAGLIISQAYGAGNREKIQQVIIGMVWTMGVLTVINALIGFFLCPFLLRLLGVPENCFDYAVTYMKIIFAFCFGTMLYNGAASILRSIGDSRRPLYCLIAASLINVGLDLAFILGLHMGVAGAAYATIISQIVSGISCTCYVYKERDDLGFQSTSFQVSWRPAGSTIRQIIRVGLPSALQSCMISLGTMSVQRLINSFGSPVMAGFTAANKIDGLAIQVIVSLGTALSVYTGQNIGINDYGRIRKGLRQTLVMELCSAAIIAVLANVFRFQLMDLFLDASTSREAIRTGATYLSIIGVAYLISAVMQSYQNVIRGAGDVNTCFVAGIAELSGKIFFAYLLAPILGPTGIWIATPLSWACGCSVPVIRYYTGRWKLKKLV